MQISHIRVGRGRGVTKFFLTKNFLTWRKFLAVAVACAKCCKETGWLVQSLAKKGEAGKHFSAIKGPVSRGVQADCAVEHIVLMHFTRLSLTAVAELNTVRLSRTCPLS